MPRTSAKGLRTAREGALRSVGRSASIKGRSGDELLVVSFSFSFEPLLAIVDRHVKLTPLARQAIKNEWSAAVRNADLIRRLPSEDLDEVLTTEQAAKVAGVSRPFMVKLIDAGSVELHQMVGNQRRVLLSAVQRWRANERSRQAKALARLGEDLDAEIFPG